MGPGYIIISLLIICVCLEDISCDISYDYYWRDYTGDIPTDAVEGGRDVNSRTTYIGQVYVKEHGIIPVTIYPGVKSVSANIFGIHKLSSYVKILCSSSKEYFKWIPADAQRLHTQTINKHVVRGGVEYGLISNIGRIMYQGELLVAKVCGFNVGNAKLFFPAGNEEKTSESYEVLIYDGPNLSSVQARSIVPS